MQRVNLIGAGKVGSTFLSLLKHQPGVEIGAVFSRHFDVAQRAVAAIGAGQAVATLAEMPPADLWFLTVPDDKIAGVARDLARVHSDLGTETLPGGPVAVHCSGFRSSEELAPLRDLGWSIASCHPVLSFSDPAVAVRQFRGTFCGIEGDAAATARLDELIAGLGGRPFTVSTENKALYHAAAVFSNNFTVVLQALALEAWDAAGVADDVARDLCATLLGATAENVARTGPAQALTGPAARGDAEVLRRQEAVVADWHPEAADLYRVMSQLARRLKRSGTTLAPRDGSP